MTSAKLKDVAIKGLKVLKFAADIASKFFPPVSVVGSVIGAVLGVVEERKSIKDLQKDFKLFSQGLDDLQKENHQIMEDIIKGTADKQFEKLQWTLLYEKYLEFINAPMEEQDKAGQEFVKKYQDEQGNQHLYTLYESVISVPKVFGKPILQVYKHYSGCNRDIMTKLSEELFTMFSIGIITMMAHAVLIEDDVESRKKEWEEKMMSVTSEMKKALEDFK